MKFKRGIFLTMLFSLLIVYAAYASGNYIKDDAGVLKSSTIDQVNTNLGKLEANTGAQVRIQLVKSLQGKDIMDSAFNIAKTETTTNKHAVFLVSIGDHKSKLLVGEGLNAVFTPAELDKIAALPNEYFKKNDFNTGILKVGQALDQDITTKAVKTKKAEVVNDGLGKTVQPKKSHTGSVVVLIILVIAIIVIIYLVKKKSNDKMRKFAKDNNMNYNSSNNNSFRSGNVSGGSNRSGSSQNSTFYDQGPSGGSVNNTTVINNNGYGGMGGNGFVEGMIVGEMLGHSHEHHHHHDDYYDSPQHNSDSNSSSNDSGSSSWFDDDSNKVSSGDWNISSGDSDWGSSSSDNSSSWDSGSSFDSGSSYDSGSSGGSDW